MRKHNYMVGYRGEKQGVYGKEVESIDRCNVSIMPLTLPEAERLSKKIYTIDGKKKIKSVVYKLVEVKSEGAKLIVRTPGLHGMSSKDSLYITRR